jgi:muramoyltetrapeptide carboxypeptidase
MVVEIFKSARLLRAGDKIAITAPARKIDRALVERSIDILQEWGLQVVLSTNLFAGTHSYLSGTDEERYRDLQALINDDSIQGILCARGGYGSARITDRIDLSALYQNPKWLIGFSDITSLHLKFLKSGIQSLHATMPVLFPRAESAISVESLRKILFNGSATLSSTECIYNKPGQCEGVVVGGNLSLIVDSLGTKTELDTDDKILVIEEIDEYFYKVDRMLTQLKRAGKLHGLKGLVVGHMTDIKNGELTFATSFEAVILDAVAEYNYPVGFKFPTGHENPNLAWIQGGTAQLSVTRESGILKFAPIKANS